VAFKEKPMTVFAKRMWWVGSLFALSMAGCGVEEPDSAPDNTAAVLSWEEFKHAATRSFDGKEFFVVDGDLSVSETELSAAASVVSAAPGCGKRCLSRS
jgi:hypothetical protein